MNQARRIKSAPQPAVGSKLSLRADEWEIAVYGDLTDKQSELIGRLVEIPDAGHHVMIDQPERLRLAIDDFLAEIDGRGDALGH